MIFDFDFFPDMPNLSLRVNQECGAQYSQILSTHEFLFPPDSVFFQGGMFFIAEKGKFEFLFFDERLYLNFEL